MVVRVGVGRGRPRGIAPAPAERSSWQTTFLCGRKSSRPTARETTNETAPSLLLTFSSPSDAIGRPALSRETITTPLIGK